MTCRVLDLFRLAAVDGARDTGEIAGGAGTLLVYNPLSAPVFLTFGSSTPSESAHDVACPGNALLAFPLDGSTTTITGKVIYSGAVPASDVGEAIVRVVSGTLGAFVGALA